MTSDDREDAVQRALNEHKKQELKEKYGCMFGGTSADIPPRVEADWLEYVDEFERQFAEGKRTTVRAFIGNPEVRPPAGLPPEEVPAELRRLQNLLDAHGVAVHASQQLPDTEMYRFLAEELLDAEMDDIRITGMTHNFVYEEFHPDDRRDAAMCADDFLGALFERNIPVLRTLTATHGPGEPGAESGIAERLFQHILSFLEGVAAFTHTEVITAGCDVEGDGATVRARIRWRGFRSGALDQIGGSGTAVLTMRRCVAGGWDVLDARIPGIAGDG